MTHPPLPAPLSPLPYSKVFQLLDAGCRDNARAPPQRGSFFHRVRCILHEDRREVCLSATNLLMSSSKVRLCICFFFPFSFFPFLAAFLHTTLYNYFSTCLWRYAAPRRHQATSRDGRLTWAETTMTTSLVTASGSQICTPGIVCTV